MRVKFARLIRTGIMSQCLPYVTCDDSTPDHKMHWTTLDYRTLRRYQSDWEANKYHRITRDASARTKQFTQTKVEGRTRR